MPEWPQNLLFQFFLTRIQPYETFSNVFKYSFITHRNTLSHTHGIVLYLKNAQKCEGKFRTIFEVQGQHTSCVYTHTKRQWDRPTDRAHNLEIEKKTDNLSVSLSQIHSQNLALISKFFFCFIVFIATIQKILPQKILILRNYQTGTPRGDKYL